MESALFRLGFRARRVINITYIERLHQNDDGPHQCRREGKFRGNYGVDWVSNDVNKAKERLGRAKFKFASGHPSARRRSTRRPKNAQVDLIRCSQRSEKLCCAFTADRRNPAEILSRGCCKRRVVKTKNIVKAHRRIDGISGGMRCWRFVVLYFGQRY